MTRVCSFLAVLTAVAAGCGNASVLGIAQTAVVSAQRTEMACIATKDGTTAVLDEGHAEGRPAVAVKLRSLAGFSGALNVAVNVDGMQVFAGQKCSYGGINGARPVCTTAVVTKNGAQRMFLLQTGFFPSPAELPDSMATLVRDLRASRVLPTARQVDLDGPTYTAFVEIAKTRADNATARSATIIGGAAKLGVGQVQKDRKLAEEGKEVIAAGQAMSIDSPDREHVVRHPRLGPVFQLSNKGWWSYQQGFPLVTFVCVGAR